MKNRFKFIRETLNLTQQEFSERIKIGQSTVAQLESGVREIKDRHIKLVCDEFNVNLEWLRDGVGEMFTAETDFVALVASSLEGLDEIDRKFISEYIRLSPQHRKIIKAFIKKLIG